MNDTRQLNASIQTNPLLWAALAAMAVTALFIYPIHSMDVWWHLDSGRWMLEHHQYLGKEVRSFSLNGAPWNNFSWLFQVTIALLYKLGGMWSLMIFKALLVWLMLMLLFLSIGMRGAPLSWLLVITLFSWQIIPHIYLRPHLLEGVFLALLVWLVQREPKRRDIVWYALLILIWANTHASVVIGVAALSLHYLMGPRFTWPPVPELMRRLPLTLLLALLMFATPNGLHLLDVLIGHTHGLYMHTYIKEWRAPEHLPALFLPVLAAILGATFLKIRILRPAELFLIVFFLFLSLDSKRFLFELGLVLIRPSGMLIGLLLARAGELFPRMAGRNGWLLGGLVLATAVLSQELPFPWKIINAKDYPVSGRFYPHVAMSVLQPVIDGEPELRVWNAYGWGGYIGWRGNRRVKVYIDGRTPTVFKEEMLVTSTLASSRPNMLRSLAKAWKVEAILLHRRQFPLFLQSDPVWRLVAYDKGSVLYLRSDIAQRYGIEAIGFDPFRPLRRVASNKLQDYIRQLRQLLARDADNSLAWLHLGEFLGQLHMINPARQGESELLAAMQRAIEEAPDQIQARIRMAIWLAYLGHSSDEIIKPVMPVVWKISDEQRSAYAISLAKLFIQTGHPQQALRILSFKQPRLQQKLDHAFIAWLLRLEAYLDLGDKAGAAKINEIAAAMAFDAPPLLLARYQALLAANPDIAGAASQ